MKIDIKLLLLVISAIIILSLLQHTCNRNTETAITTTTTVRIDTLKCSDTVYFPKPYSVTVLCTDTLYIDTSAVIRDYFTDKHYLLQYQDTVLKANSDIKISKNAVELVKFDYEVYRPTIHTTTVITEKSVQRFAFSLGGGVNYSIIDKRAGIEILAGIDIKRNSLHFGYDFINQTPHIGWKYQIIKK